MKLKSLFVAAMLASSCFVYADGRYTIYPIPQKEVSGTGTTSFTSTVDIIAESGIDEATRNRVKEVLQEHGLIANFTNQSRTGVAAIWLGVNHSGQAADNRVSTLGLDRSLFTNGRYDRHVVSLTNDGGVARLVILGENTDATFYGLASLEQMLDGGHTDMPCITIYDYADIKNRGIVEGYYGYPYSVSVKKDLMRFMMRYKMNTYLYGAKSDPYHSEKWMDAYPISVTAQQETNGWLSQAMLREVTAESHATKVNFIWAIHPGNKFLGSNTVINDIMGKFAKMYDLGVRQFGVFVDDVGIPSDDAGYKLNADRLTQLQKAMDSKYNVAGAAAADTVKPLHFVPQIYCRNFASSEEQFTKFFNALGNTPSKITIYTTGWGVWSVPNSRDLNVTATPLGRNVGWWWNYPCNDNADSQIFASDMYSNFVDMPAVGNNSTLPASLNGGISIVSNPMQQGEIAKIPVFSVADYAWHTASFNNQNSWQAAVNSVLGSKAAAFRSIAPYLRWNDAATLNNKITAYKASHNPTELRAEMQRIADSCKVLETLASSTSESDRLFYRDIHPWIFKLRDMATATAQFLDVAALENTDEAKWQRYVETLSAADTLNSANSYKVYALEGMGSGISVSTSIAKLSEQYLKPFIEYLKAHALDGFFKKTEQLSKPSPISNKEGAFVRVVWSEATQSGYINTPQPITLEKGQYVGVEFPNATRLASLVAADTLLNNFWVQYSADGKKWTRLKLSTAPESFMRYLIIQNNNAATRSVRLQKARLNFQFPTLTKVKGSTIPAADIYDNHTANLFIDGNPATFTCIRRNQQTGDIYQMELTETTPIDDIRLYMGTTNGDYPNGALVQISENGTSWTSLKVKGTNQTTFRINLPQVTKLNNDVSYCDFEGGHQKARFVRLNVTNPNTSKWLRLYDIVVNRQSYLEKFLPRVTADGSEVLQLTDGEGATKATAAQEIVIRLDALRTPKSLTVYQKATGANVDVEVTKDFQSWQSLGTLSSSYVSVVDLTAVPEATGVRFRWTGVAPQIYEITTQLSEVDKLTAVQTPQVQGNLQLRVGVEGLTLSPAENVRSLEVHDLSGRLVYTQNLTGESCVTVPFVYSGHPAMIITAVRKDGSTASFKVLTR
jgi:hyaluronoglucosaminidase